MCVCVFMYACLRVCVCIKHAQYLRGQKRALDFLGPELQTAVNFCVRAEIQTWIFGMSRKCGFLLVTGHQLTGHYIALIQNTTWRVLIESLRDSPTSSVTSQTRLHRLQDSLPWSHRKPVRIWVPKGLSSARVPNTSTIFFQNNMIRS